VTNRLKQTALFLLKYAIGLSLLIWIVRKVNPQKVADILFHLPPLTLLQVELLSLCGLAVQFYLWRYLIRRHSDHHTLRDLVASFFAGFALRLMIPGGHAEISKVFLLPGRKRGKIIAFGAEKFFQTLFKIIFISLALLFIFPQKRLLLGAVGAAGILVYLFLPKILHGTKMKDFQEKEVSYYPVFLVSLMLTIPMLLIIALQYYLLLQSVGTISLFRSLLVATFIWGAGLIPISISGLGVRENLAVYFLGLYGISGSAAVGVSLLVFVINVILPALAGLVILFLRRKELGGAGSEIKAMTQRVWHRKKNPRPDGK